MIALVELTILGELFTQESIPEGWIPTAKVVSTTGVGGRVRYITPGYPLPQWIPYPWKGPGTTPSTVGRMTDTCENFTTTQRPQYRWWSVTMRCFKTDKRLIVMIYYAQNQLHLVLVIFVPYLSQN